MPQRDVPVMAGRFLSLEEAARQLGVSVDEVNRLVDRKKLFPMRDGATVKFKADDIDRVARDLGDDNSQSGDLALDLDLDLPAAGGAAEEISLGDPLDGTESIFSALRQVDCNCPPDAAGCAGHHGALVVQCAHSLFQIPYLLGPKSIFPTKRAIPFPFVRRNSMFRDEK